MKQPPFQTKYPENRTSCVVFASPHSGRQYSEAFLQQSILDKNAIRSSEDAFVDILFERAADYGAAFINAQTPRAYVDLNRNSDELDPALIRGVFSKGYNPRIASGLGVVARVVSHGRPIYNGKIPLSEVQERLNTHWYPYHHALEELLRQSHALFGEAILIDCHSMPHEAIENSATAGRVLPDVVLGDRFGAAASADVTDQIEDAFVRVGLNVVRNKPFSGAYITQRYGRPSRNQHVVQVEINRSLYMDEPAIQPNDTFQGFQGLMTSVVKEISNISGFKVPLAAE